MSESELICTTAYVDLFLRRISEPSLLAVFLRFIFTDSCDDKNIIDTLTIRISSQTKVRQTSLFMSVFKSKFQHLIFFPAAVPSDVVPV
jgi:hypothetical protein